MRRYCFIWVMGDKADTLEFCEDGPHIDTALNNNWSLAFTPHYDFNDMYDLYK